MNRLRAWRGPLAVLVVGSLTCVAAAARASMTTSETVELVGIAAGISALGLLAALLVTHRLRTRPLRVQIVALVVITIVAMMLGASIAARAMFISEHDLSVLVVVFIAGGTVAIVSTLVVGRRVETATRTLGRMARDIGSGGDATPGAVPLDAPSELLRLGEELQVAEHRLAEARAHEQRIERSRRELVAGVSHDLRTPLAGMRAIVEMLQDGIVDDPKLVAGYLGTLGEEVDRLARLVNDLFELSRTQAGALALHFERVSLAELVSEAVAGVASVAAAKGVRLERHLEAPPTELVVSAPEVVRALRNLLDNAIRHTPRAGSVIVTAGLDAADASFVSFVVADSGGGVAAADLERVFDVAFQGDRARTPGSGAGLGLAIAKGFVEAHHGDLTVRNENGGARFTMRLPVAAN